MMNDQHQQQQQHHHDNNDNDGGEGINPNNPFTNPYYHGQLPPQQQQQQQQDSLNNNNQFNPQSDSPPPPPLQQQQQQYPPMQEESFTKIEIPTQLNLGQIEIDDIDDDDDDDDYGNHDSESDFRQEGYLKGASGMGGIGGGIGGTMGDLSGIVIGTGAAAAAVVVDGGGCGNTGDNHHHQHDEDDYYGDAASSPVSSAFTDSTTKRRDHLDVANGDATTARHAMTAIPHENINDNNEEYEDPEIIFAAAVEEFHQSNPDFGREESFFSTDEQEQQQQDDDFNQEPRTTAAAASSSSPSSSPYHKSSSNGSKKRATYQSHTSSYTEFTEGTAWKSCSDDSSSSSSREGSMDSRDIHSVDSRGSHGSRGRGGERGSQRGGSRRSSRIEEESIGSRSSSGSSRRSYDDEDGHHHHHRHRHQDSYTSHDHEEEDEEHSHYSNSASSHSDHDSYKEERSIHQRRRSSSQRSRSKSKSRHERRHGRQHHRHDSDSDHGSYHSEYSDETSHTDDHTDDDDDDDHAPKRHRKKNSSSSSRSRKHNDSHSTKSSSRTEEEEEDDYQNTSNMYNSQQSLIDVVILPLMDPEEEDLDSQLAKPIDVMPCDLEGGGGAEGEGGTTMMMATTTTVTTVPTMNDGDDDDDDIESAPLVKAEQQQQTSQLADDSDDILSISNEETSNNKMKKEKKTKKQTWILLFTSFTLLCLGAAAFVYFWLLPFLDEKNERKQLNNSKWAAPSSSPPGSADNNLLPHHSSSVLDEDAPCAFMSLMLVTDIYGNETSWELFYLGEDGDIINDNEGDGNAYDNGGGSTLSNVPADPSLMFSELNIPRDSTTLTIPRPTDLRGDNSDTSAGKKEGRLRLRQHSIIHKRQAQETQPIVIDSGGPYKYLNPQSPTYDKDTSGQYTSSICLPQGNYKFVLSDLNGDGMCCQYGMGAYGLYFNGGRFVRTTSPGEFMAKDVTEFKVMHDDIMAAASSVSPSQSPRPTMSNHPTGTPSASPTYPVDSLLSMETVKSSDVLNGISKSYGLIFDIETNANISSLNVVSMELLIDAAKPVNYEIWTKSGSWRELDLSSPIFYSSFYKVSNGTLVGNGVCQTCGFATIPLEQFQDVEIKGGETRQAFWVSLSENNLVFKTYGGTGRRDSHRRLEDIQQVTSPEFDIYYGSAVLYYPLEKVNPKTDFRDDMGFMGRIWYQANFTNGYIAQADTNNPIAKNTTVPSLEPTVSLEAFPSNAPSYNESSLTKAVNASIPTYFPTFSPTASFAYSQSMVPSSQSNSSVANASLPTYFPTYFPTSSSFAYSSSTVPSSLSNNSIFNTSLPTYFPTSSVSYSPSMVPSSQSNNSIVNTSLPTYFPTPSLSLSPSMVPSSQSNNSSTNASLSYSPSTVPSSQNNISSTNASLPTYFPTYFPTLSAVHSPSAVPSLESNNSSTNASLPTYFPTYFPTPSAVYSPSAVPSLESNNSSANASLPIYFPTYFPTPSDAHSPSAVPSLESNSSSANASLPAYFPTYFPTPSVLFSPLQSPSTHPTISNPDGISVPTYSIVETMTDDGLQWNSTFEEEIQTTPSNLTDDAEIQLNVSGIMGEQSINLTTDNELNNEAEIDSDSTLDPPTDPPTASSTLSIMDDFSNPYTLSFSIESNLERSRFGSSVAISSDGKVLAIGATDARNEFGDATGAVYLYGISSAGGSGVSQTFLQAIHGESAGDFFGGAIAMSEYGNHIVIGSRAEGGLVGAMRVYERKNPSIVNDWTPMGDAIVGETPSGQAGWSVAISGDGNIVAMGAPKGGNGGGAVEAFKYGLNSSLALVWLPHGSVVMGPALDEAAGYSISLSHNGRIIAVGSPKASNPIGAPFSGKTLVYSFTGIGWMKVSEIFGDAASDIDGTSVALSGDGKVLVVGGKGRDENSLSNVGYCRIFEWKDTPFGFSYSLIGEIAEERMGYFVAISPDGNVVSCGGVNGNLNGVANTGTVRVFNRGTLQESTIWPRSDTISTWEASSFGSSIALSSDGRYLVVGAPVWSGSSGDLNGAVQVFNFY